MFSTSVCDGVHSGRASKLKVVGSGNRLLINSLCKVVALIKRCHGWPGSHNIWYN